MASRRPDRSVFDNPLLTPPPSDYETGTWDDSGPLRGWTIDLGGRKGEFDFIIEESWEAHGHDCLLLRVTDLVVLKRGRGPERVGELETFYRGYVHAPDVESLPKGCYGTHIVDCYPDGHWFAWDERTLRNRCSHRKPVKEQARKKTERLARAAKNREEGRI